jgi:para-nitrobenzyl esterase
VSLDPVGSLLAAVVVLLIGTLISRSVPYLSKHNIPEPITGGLLLAALLLTSSCARLPPQGTEAGLGGTSWQLVRFQGGDGPVLVPDDRVKYTIAFGADGMVSARIDCNRGRGTWNSPGTNQLQLGPLALTRAMCPPGSLHDHIVKQWEFVRSYLIKDGRLFLSLMADGGIYEFEPLKGQ